MLDGSPIGIFTDMIVVVVFIIHIHHDPIPLVGGLGQHIEHAADELSVPPVKQVGVELGAACEEGRTVCPGGYSCPAWQTVEELFHIDLQGPCDLIKGLHVKRDLPFLILGDRGLALADDPGQIV